MQDRLRSALAEREASVSLGDTASARGITGTAGTAAAAAAAAAGGGRANAQPHGADIAATVAVATEATADVTEGQEEQRRRIARLTRENAEISRQLELASGKWEQSQAACNGLYVENTRLHEQVDALQMELQMRSQEIADAGRMNDELAHMRHTRGLLVEQLEQQRRQTAQLSAQLHKMQQDSENARAQQLAAVEAYTRHLAALERRIEEQQRALALASTSAAQPRFGDANRPSATQQLTTAAAQLPEDAETAGAKLLHAERTIQQLQEEIAGWKNALTARTHTMEWDQSVARDAFEANAADGPTALSETGTNDALRTAAYGGASQAHDASTRLTDLAIVLRQRDELDAELAVERARAATLQDELETARSSAAQAATEYQRQLDWLRQAYDAANARLRELQDAIDADATALIHEEPADDEPPGSHTVSATSSTGGRPLWPPLLMQHLHEQVAANKQLLERLDHRAAEVSSLQARIAELERTLASAASDGMLTGQPADTEASSASDAAPVPAPVDAAAAAARLASQQPRASHPNTAADDRASAHATGRDPSGVARPADDATDPVCATHDTVIRRLTQRLAEQAAQSAAVQQQLEARCKALVVEVDQLTQRVNDADAVSEERIADARRQWHMELAAKVTEVQQRLEAVERERQTLLVQLQAAREREREQQGDIADRAAKLTALAAQRAALDGEYATFKANCEDVIRRQQEALVQCRQQLQEAEMSKEQLLAARDTLAREMQSLRSEHEHERTDAAARLDATRRELDAAQSRAESVAGENAQLRAALHQLEAAQEAASARHAEQCRAYEARISAVERTLMDAQSTRDSLAGEADAVRTATREHVHELQRAVRALRTALYACIDALVAFRGAGDGNQARSLDTPALVDYVQAELVRFAVAAARERSDARRIGTSAEVEPAGPASAELRAQLEEAENQCALAHEQMRQMADAQSQWREQMERDEAARRASMEQQRTELRMRAQQAQSQLEATGLERDRLSEELRRLQALHERRLAEHAALQQRVTQLEAERAELHSRLANSADAEQANSAAAARAMESLKLELQQYSRTCEALQQHVQAKTDELDALRLQAAAAEQAAQRQVAELTADLDRLRGTHAACEPALAAAVAERDSLRKQHALLQHDLQVLLDEKRAWTRERQQSQHATEEVRAELRHLREALKQSKQAWEESVSVRSSSEADADGDAAPASVADDLRRLEEDLRRAQQESAQRALESARLQADCARLRALQEEMDAQNRLLRERVGALEQQAASAAAECREAAAAVAQKVRQNNRLRRQVGRSLLEVRRCAQTCDALQARRSAHEPLAWPPATAHTGAAEVMEQDRDQAARLDTADPAPPMQPEAARTEPEAPASVLPPYPTSQWPRPALSRPAVATHAASDSAPAPGAEHMNAPTTLRDDAPADPHTWGPPPAGSDEPAPMRPQAMQADEWRGPTGERAEVMALRAQVEALARSIRQGIRDDPDRAAKVDRLVQMRLQLQQLQEASSAAAPVPEVDRSAPPPLQTAAQPSGRMQDV